MSEDKEEQKGRWRHGSREQRVGERGGGWRRNQRRGEREKGKMGGIEIGTEGREESKSD